MHYCEYLWPSKFPEKEVKSVFVDQQLGRPVAAYTY